MLPRMVERGGRVHRGAQGETVFAVWVRAAFDIVSTVDGSRHTVETFGEAMDGGDEGTSKAMSAAFKYAVLQTFCVPVIGLEDADARTLPRLAADEQMPHEGWEAWREDVIAIIVSCVTHDALDLVQSRHRARLRALSKTEPRLDAWVGEAIREKRAGLPTALRREAA